MTSPARGNAVEFDDKGQMRLAAVLEVGKSIKVITEQAEEQLIAARAVSFVSDRVVDVGGGVERCAAALSALRGELDDMLAGAEVREVWELLSAEGEPVSLEALADWLFGEATSVQVWGATLAMRANPAFFKKRKDELWEPRGEKQVEALLQQQEAEARAASLNERFVSLLRRLSLEHPVEDEGRIAARRQELEGALEEPELRKRFELIERYAVEGDLYDKAGQAGALLDTVSHEAGAEVVRLGGKGAVRALKLLIKVGRFEVHENLFLRRYNIDPAIDPIFEEMAKSLVEGIAWLDAVDLSGIELDGREDLTGLQVVTIDDASTRDIDDGLSAARLSDGRIEIGVHIADPAEIVPLDHPLEAEARRRGTTVYLPEGTIPMFPRALSERAMSLVEGLVRPALSFIVVFDGAMEPVERRVTRSWVKVARRLSYEGVDEALAGGDEGGEIDTLRLLDAAARARKAWRLSQGAVSISIPEARVSARVGGECEVDVEIRLQEDTASRDLVQEMMVLAGETAGLHCQARGLPVIYRIQESPEDMSAVAAASGQSETLAGAFSMRRLMKRGSLSPVPRRHFGLGLEIYVQATSPIRRYSDLLVHRQIQAELRGAPLPFDEVQVGGLSGQVEGLSGDASIVERESKRYWTLVHIQGLVGEVLPATVVGFLDDRRRRALVWLDALGFTAALGLTGDVEEGAAIQVKVDTARPRQDLLVVRMVDSAS